MKIVSNGSGLYEIEIKKTKIMIERKIYLMAQEIVKDYEAQFQAPVMHQLSPDLDRNDFVEYIGGSDSQYLTIGYKYRLIRKPDLRHRKIVIENDASKRMIAIKRYFKGA